MLWRQFWKWNITYGAVHNNANRWQHRQKQHTSQFKTNMEGKSEKLAKLVIVKCFAYSLDLAVELALKMPSNMHSDTYRYLASVLWGCRQYPALISRYRCLCTWLVSLAPLACRRDTSSHGDANRTVREVLNWHNTDMMQQREAFQFMRLNLLNWRRLCVFGKYLHQVRYLTLCKKKILANLFDLTTLLLSRWKSLSWTLLLAVR